MGAGCYDHGRVQRLRMDACGVLGNLFDGGFITLKLANPSFEELLRSPSFEGGYLGAIALEQGSDFVQLILCHRQPASFLQIKMMQIQ